jgi:hypothetical protein
LRNAAETPIFNKPTAMMQFPFGRPSLIYAPAPRLIPKDRPLDRRL